jgi:site-specific DNA-adenine methylase
MNPTVIETITPPLKWHGGKWYIAEKVIDLMPRHLHYVEPYAGGLAVLLAKNPYDPSKYWGEKGYEQGVSEVVNDLHRGLTNFWRVLQREDPAPLGTALVAPLNSVIRAQRGSVYSSRVGYVLSRKSR